MAKTRRRNVHRRKTKKHHRRHRTKRRVKRRRKTTRKKRGRGIGPSKMAKLGVAALAATAAMGQGTGHGISPSKGTVAAVNHFKQVDCKDFHIGDMVEHSEDHGMSTEHYRPVLQAAIAKKRYCKRNKKPMRNPNTGKRMSKKKQKQANRRNQQRQEQERKNQQQQRQQQEPQSGETSGSTSGVGDSTTAMATAGMITGAAAHYYMRKKRQEEAERKRQQEEEKKSKSSNSALFDDFGIPLASLKLQDEPTKKKKKTVWRTFKSKLSQATGIRRNKTRKNPQRG